MKDVRELTRGLAADRNAGEHLREGGTLAHESVADVLLREGHPTIIMGSMLAFRQLASGLRMQLDGDVEAGKALEAGALRQFRSLGIRDIYFQDEEGREERHPLHILLENAIGLEACAVYARSVAKRALQEHLAAEE